MKLKEVTLKLNLGKCKFAKTNICFLGHIVSKEGTPLDQWNIIAITQFPVLVTVTNVRAFLGLIGYYENYVEGYSKLAVPLFELTWRDATFSWSNECQNAFNVLKDALVKAPILIRLYLLNLFILDVDRSTKGVGAILSQWVARNE